MPLRELPDRAAGAVAQSGEEPADGRPQVRSGPFPLGEVRIEPRRDGAPLDAIVVSAVSRTGIESAKVPVDLMLR